MFKGEKVIGVNVNSHRGFLSVTTKDTNNNHKTYEFGYGAYKEHADKVQKILDATDELLKSVRN